MNSLCIDIGNTTTHYGVLEGARVLWEERFPTKLLIANRSVEMVKRLNLLKAKGFEWEGVALCSVVPVATESLWVQLKGCSARVFQLSYEDCPGLAINYPEPKEIGQDRLANAIGAQVGFGTPVVVLDMGTAITLDVVSNQGGYEGGLIAPGLGVMTDYLHERTALLPAVNLEEMVRVKPMAGVGKSTVTAIRMGCGIGFAAMVKGLIKVGLAEVSKLGEPTPSVVATGGNVRLLFEELKDIQFDPYLTLKGLSEAFKRRMKG